MTRLVPSRPNAVFAALADLDLSSRNTFKITGSGGVMSIHVKWPGGRVESMRVRAKGSFQQFSQFDPSQLGIDERRQLELDMHNEGLSQSEIADLLGVSQATVSLDLKKIKQKQEK